MDLDKIQISVKYNGKDISEDISKYCIGVQYKDNVEGSSDTVEIRLEDIDGLWKGSWYPEKGAELTVAIGKNGELMDCGVFEIDQIQMSGPPDIVVIQGIAAGTKTGLRTKNNGAHANKTLLQIANTVAKKHGLTLVDSLKKFSESTVVLTNEISQLSLVYNKIVSDLNSNTDFLLTKKYASEVLTLTQLLSVKGLNEDANALYATALDAYQNPTKVNTLNLSLVLKRIIDYMKSINGKNSIIQSGTDSGIINIVVERFTQNNETDLAFLNRIGSEYGYVFSVRGKKLIFMHQQGLEELGAKFSVDRKDLTDYSITDKTLKTYSKVEVKYHNPKTATVSTYTETIENKDDVPFTYIKSTDTLVIHTKAENEQQAKAKAQAAIYRANSLQQEGSISMSGNPYACAGNNFDLTGLGLISGKFHIMGSSHSVDRGGGWDVNVEIKKVGFVIKEKTKSTKKKKTQKYNISVVK